MKVRSASTFELLSEHERMAEEIRVSYGPHWKLKPPTKEQQPSTMKALAAQAERPIELDEEYWARPLPKPEEVYADPEAVKKFHETGDYSWIDKAVGRREFDAEAVALADVARHRPKNQVGQSEESAFSEERRKSAVHHFMVTPGIKASDLTEIERRRIVGLEKIESAATTEVWVKMNLFRAIGHWLRGGKIRSVKTGYEGWKKL